MEGRPPGQLGTDIGIDLMMSLNILMLLLLVKKISLAIRIYPLCFL
jgi:hypothetical protein